MRMRDRLFLTSMVSLMSACAVAESEVSKLALISPYEITLTQDAVERAEVRVPPTCGRMFVKGHLESLNETNTRSTTLTALLGEFCNDPWAFRLNKSYVVDYRTTSDGENEIVNAAEVILWNDDGVHVLWESWLIDALPVTVENIQCAAIQVGPFPGMTDFDDEECSRFDAEKLLSESAFGADSQ